jgi:hypothetical protein
VVDEHYIWYTCNGDIYRLDKLTGEPVCLTDEYRLLPEHIRSYRFISMMNKGKYLYLTSDKGFFRLHKEKFLFGKSSIEINECNSFTSFEDKIFVYTRYGLFQIPFDILEKSFGYKEILF